MAERAKSSDGAHGLRMLRPASRAPPPGPDSRSLRAAGRSVHERDRGLRPPPSIARARTLAPPQSLRPSARPRRREPPRRAPRLSRASANAGSRERVALMRTRSYEQSVLLRILGPLPATDQDAGCSVRRQPPGLTLSVTRRVTPSEHRGGKSGCRSHSSCIVARWEGGGPDVARALCMDALTGSTHAPCSTAPPDARSCSPTARTTATS